MLLVLFVLLWTESCWSAKKPASDSPVYPAFPPNFTASLQTDVYGSPQFTRLYVSRWKDDAGKQKYKILSNETNSLLGNHTYLIMTDPPGALPGSLTYKNKFLFIQLGSKCTYTGNPLTMGSDLPIGFPSFLGFYDFQDTCIGLQICANMTYNKTQMYHEKRVDVWKKLIRISSPLGPDRLTVYADASTGIPIHGERFHPGMPHSFDPTEDIMTDATDITIGHPDIDIDSLLPPDWARVCHNEDTNWNTEPAKDNFYVTPKGGDGVDFYLEDPPAWGNVTVTFEPHTFIESCSCMDCFVVTPPVLVFNQQNYAKPQSISFEYRKPGCGDVSMSFRGSNGWEGKSRTEWGMVYACKDGLPGKSCFQE